MKTGILASLLPIEVAEPKANVIPQTTFLHTQNDNTDLELAEIPFNESQNKPEIDYESDWDHDCAHDKNSVSISLTKAHTHSVSKDEVPTTSNHGLGQVPLEYRFRASPKLMLLACYLALNLILTMGNKTLLAQLSFPWLLTCLHATATTIGCACLLHARVFTLSKLRFSETSMLVAFSMLFTLNISISNLSLSLVSVPFHQVIRSTTPVCTVVLYRVFYGRSFGSSTYSSLVPLVVGAGLITYGEYRATSIGVLVTFLGVFLAASKTIVTNQFMTNTTKSIPPLELLFRLAPLAAVQSMAIALMTGEVSQVCEIMGMASLRMRISRLSINKVNNKFDGSSSAITSQFETKMLILITIGLILNGVVAFVLNVVSMKTNKVAGALTLSVCGNLKMCLTVLIGVVVFEIGPGRMAGSGFGLSGKGGGGGHTNIGEDAGDIPGLGSPNELVTGVPPFRKMLRMGGMVIAIAGAAWFSWVELQINNRRRDSK